MLMKTDRDNLYLLHIRECLERVTDYTAGGWEKFQNDLMAQDAVLRNLQIMGESTQRLSASLKASWPDIDWQDIAAFRNRLVHDYQSINLKQVWQIIADDLPAFKQEIEAILQSMNPA